MLLFPAQYWRLSLVPLVLHCLQTEVLEWLIGCYWCRESYPFGYSPQALVQIQDRLFAVVILSVDLNLYNGFVIRA